MKKPKLMAKVPKEKDLETHVRQCWIGGVEFVEVRDFIPSTKTYSRGLVFERRHVPQMLEAIATAK